MSCEQLFPRDAERNGVFEVPILARALIQHIDDQKRRKRVEQGKLEQKLHRKGSVVIGEVGRNRAEAGEHRVDENGACGKQGERHIDALAVKDSVKFAPDIVKHGAPP